MTLLPQPPSSAEAPRGSSSTSSGLPDGYHDQFDVVLQILKDRVSRYDKSRVSPDQKRPNITPPDEISDGHSHLTAQGLRDDVYTRSERLVEDELDVLKYRNPAAYWTIDTYFGVDSGHSDYDDLEEKAKTIPSASENWQRLQISLYLLVSRLLDSQLYCRFGKKFDTRTNRRRTMEEQYAEINRVFESWCKDLSRRHKCYRNKAYENTALQLDVAKSTVERAVKFMAKNNPSKGASAA